MTIRGLNRLGRGEIDTLPDGSHSDGGGLYLTVSGGGKRRSWVFRYTSPATGKVREMGLGRAGQGGVPLKGARDERDRLRTLLRDGLDPLAERARRKAEQAGKRSFAEAAEAVLAGKAAGWKGGAASSSLKAWRRTLKVEAAKLAKRPVDEISVDEVERTVAPMWDRGSHVEARLALNRLEAVFGLAIARGWRTAANPAAWEVFEHLAPARPFGEAKHHPALPWQEAPTALARLRQSPGMAPLALEFAILTGVRIGEALGATYAEMDLERSIWTVPPERMKRAKEFVVPLSDRALEIAKALHERRGKSRYVFPGQRPGKPLHRAVVYDLSMRVSEGKASVHGWRATLRSWCSDHSVPFEVAEAILAHSKASVVAAYDRSAMVERRRPVMENWSRFLSGEEQTAEIIPMPARRA
jgi:integrase